MHYKYSNRGTCSRSVEFDLNGGVVTGIRFTGGCDGNLKAIGKLLEGASAQDIISKCAGNTCGGKATSCADQLARAVADASKNGQA